jgi:DNA-binding beta-propeller fold protein YncE
MKKIIYLLSVLLLFSACNFNGKKPVVWLAEAPAGSLPVHIDKKGKTVLPNGRFITPAGKCITTAPHPYGLTLSNDGTIAVTANSGTKPLSITIIKNLQTDSVNVLQIPPGSDTDGDVLGSVFMGLAVSPDNKIVYVSGGETNKIYLFEIETGKSAGTIDCSFVSDSVDYSTGYIGDLVLSKDGRMLYAVDQIGFRVVMIDVKKKKLLHSIPVGRYPFGIRLSPDEKRLYVANVGMFRYAWITSGDSAKVTPVDFPAFAYQSKEMREGIHNDTIDIPGLGDPNSIEAFSVFTIDLWDSAGPTIVSKIKTGHLAGSMVEGIPAVGGSSPNSVVATGDYVFVSNGNNDNISVISTKKDTVIYTINLKPDKRMKHFRGVIPFGLALSPDNKRLYVAASGINAVAVISVPDFTVKGYIPAGWFPAKLKVTADGKKLVIANAKGYGSGPNGGKDFVCGDEGSYIGSLMKGTVQVVDVPNDTLLKKMTEKVIENNFRFVKVTDSVKTIRGNNPVPLYPGFSTGPIKHIVFISKENRTYDEVLGQIKTGNGDAALARYGEQVTFYNRKKTDSVVNTTVMPNHLALARKFAFSDNFYVDSDVSADGHRWLVNTYPNEWVETCTAASYGGNRWFIDTSNAPGIFAMNGAAGAIYPEDYNEAGSLWDHLERHGKRFYNFGFSIMFEPAVYKPEFKYTGLQHIINYPVPQPLYNRTSRTYPTYNTGIPDQFRIDRFISVFNAMWMNGADTMPEIITVIIPNDHGAGERPDDGYPFRESYMADNDLAVGRIVEFLSHTPYWKNMMIVITEDDAQNGVDHVDAHRSILLVVSPWVKKQYVSHVHYSFGSIFKTFWNIMGLPYLNQYDAGATDMSDFFTSHPDFTPYNALPVDTCIFNPLKAYDPLDEEFNWEAVKNSPEMDNVKDMLRDSKEQDKDRMEDRERR